jgi:hypothetical protein
MRDIVPNHELPLLVAFRESGPSGEHSVDDEWEGRSTAGIPGGLVNEAFTNANGAGITPAPQPLHVVRPDQRCVTLILLLEPVWAMPMAWPEPTCVTLAALWLPDCETSARLFEPVAE